MGALFVAERRVVVTLPDCFALSSAQILPEWTISTSPDNAFQRTAITVFFAAERGIPHDPDQHAAYVGSLDQITPARQEQASHAEEMVARRALG
jgi:hypothetical protein